MDIDRFKAICYFPDGSIYDENSWQMSELSEHCPRDISDHIFLDSRKHSHEFCSPIGSLDFIWSGSEVFGVSTFKKKGTTINTAVYLTGKDDDEESKLLKYYIDSWRGFDVVRELSSNFIETFESAINANERPLMVSVNWATIEKYEYDQIAYYDLFVAASYFDFGGRSERDTEASGTCRVN